MNTAERRQTLKDTLVQLAERSIEKSGLGGVKARDLAAAAGCSVGAIYNAVADLDDLVLIVNERTLTAIGALLADNTQNLSSDSPQQAAQQLVHLAHAYLHYAAANRQRWRALFDHRLAEGRLLPDGYVEKQGALFALIEAPLKTIRPDLPAHDSVLLARSLFSAVHGVIQLGLEEKIATLSVAELENQIRIIVIALCRGLTSGEAI